MHRATVLLRVSTVVAFYTALIGGRAVGAKAEYNWGTGWGTGWCALASPPEGMPMWGPYRVWLGPGLVFRCLSPGFIVLALGPG